MLKKWICLFGFIGAFVETAKAQDIHFSQFYASPLSLSPDNAGNFEGDWRIMGNYRTQWKEVTKPYLTNSIGFDKQFYVFNEKLSGGLFLINDKSGGNLRVMKIFGSAAYHKKIAKNVLHAGLQVGYISKKITPPDETYPNQLNWERGQFDKTIPNYEYTLNAKLSYVDVNLGLGWNRRFKKAEPFVSLAFFHMNYPKESFNENKNHLKPRILLSGGSKWFYSDKLTFVPRFCYMQTTRANEFILGANVVFKLNDGDAKSGPTSVFSGAFFRYGIGNLFDAAFAVVGMTYKRVEVGVSYDANVSELHVASSYRGAFEISVIYTGLSTRLTKKEIPCDRY